MAKIKSDEFWKQIEEEMWDEIAVVVVSIILAGIDGGAALLPSSAQSIIKFDTLYSAVREYAEEYRFNLIRGINDTTRVQTIAAIDEWLDSGKPLSKLEDALVPIFGESRAEKIAVTETTRLFARGNQAAWESTGLVSSVTWMTANDDRVCDVCDGLDGSIIGVGDIDAMPPLHVNCRCYLQPVFDDKAFDKAIDDILES